MPFISVVPAVRTPIGVDCFDYRIPENASVNVGDLVLVPFRKRSTIALVVARSHTSAFADKAVEIDPAPILSLGASSAELLQATAQHTFSSRPTVFASWMRTAPRRLPSIPSSSHPSSSTPQNLTFFTSSRIQTIIQHASSATGRTLILTPWQHRAEAIASRLEASVLHADLADGAAWKTWTTFATSMSTVLVTTRIGSWLACLADTVLLDEPENDDHKQDELAPRFDGRWIVDASARIRNGLSVIRVGTTPPLGSVLGPSDIPSIELPLTLEPWQGRGRTDLPGLSPAAIEQLEAAIEASHPVIVLHPVRGDRSRIHCRDCGWTMTCPSCSFTLTAETTTARCHRCGRTTDLPIACPSCGGSDLNASRIGKDRLASLVAMRYGTKVTVVDLPELHRLRLTPHTLVILTDLSLIGGYVEDIRRKERLIISWRRLAASVSQANGELYVLGPETLLSEARSWLSAEGLVSAWKQEETDRASFRYPPAHQRIKLLIDGEESNALAVLEHAKTALGPSWIIEGPFPVAYRSNTRIPRQILHLLPPAQLDEKELFLLLEPLAKEAIIDLDPIAFFS
jgi:primosomal protein N'